MPIDFGKGSSLVRNQSLAARPVVISHRNQLTQLMQSRSLPMLPERPKPPRADPIRSFGVRPPPLPLRTVAPPPATDEVADASSEPDAARPRSLGDATASTDKAMEPPLHFLPIDSFDDGGDDAAEGGAIAALIARATSGGDGEDGTDADGSGSEVLAHGCSRWYEQGGGFSWRPCAVLGCASPCLASTPACGRLG